MSHIYPEIQTELKAIETAFEKMAFDTAVQPADSVREELLEKIRKETQIPAGAADREASIVQLPAPAPEMNPWKWAAAAAVVLLIGASSLWMVATSESRELSGQLATLRKEQHKNSEVMTVMKLEQERISAIQAVLTEKSTINVKMAGMPMDPTASVKIMWSANENKAVMMAEAITQPPTDMQYQLWAIADGKPVSLGIFDYDEVTNMTDPFEVSMDNVSAFAITMEKRGGSPVPTMENMIVMGAVNS